MTNRIDVNQLLTEMRSLKTQARVFSPGEVGGDYQNIGDARQVGKPNGPSFGNIFSDAIEKVNGIQKESGALASAYIKGDSSVDIADVMIASQKSSVAFQAMTQVRNKVVDAYKDVMNMPL